MRCPVCGNQDTKVVDSRVTGNGHSIRRRRECVECSYRFSTLEDVEILDLALIKRDGRREPYAREKLEAGLKKALEKREHTDEAFKELVSAIEVDIQRLRRQELDSGEIGEIVMRHLKDFDSVAYIRFASVYRSFEDVETFQNELSKLSRTIGTRQKNGGS
jgi:transcriptional repressor NrdR